MRVLNVFMVIVGAFFFGMLVVLIAGKMLGKITITNIKPTVRISSPSATMMSASSSATASGSAVKAPKK